MAEALHGLSPGVLHVTSALNYTLVVLGVAILARGDQRGRAGVVRALLAAGISVRDLVLDDGHAARPRPHRHPDTAAGGVVPAGLGRDAYGRALGSSGWGRRTVLWAQIADSITLYEGAAPMVLVCAIRMYRARELRRRELSLVAASLVATGIAELVLKFIRHVGGFVLLQPQSTFYPIRFLYQNVWGMVEDLLTLFGAELSGDQVGASALVPLLHLVGVALAGWALVRAFRGFGQHGLAVQVLAVTSVVVLVAYVLRDQGGGGPHEMVGVLVACSVLAGRLLAEPLIRGRHLTVFALVLVFYAGCLGYNATQPGGRPGSEHAARDLAQRSRPDVRSRALLGGGQRHVRQQEPGNGRARYPEPGRRTHRGQPGVGKGVVRSGALRRAVRGGVPGEPGVYRGVDCSVACGGAYAVWRTGEVLPGRRVPGSRLEPEPAEQPASGPARRHLLTASPRRTRAYTGPPGPGARHCVAGRTTGLTCSIRFLW